MNSPILTLNAIRKHHPCTEGWKKLLFRLCKTKADDVPLSLLTILDSNGIDDTLWCFRALDTKYERWIRLTVAALVQPSMQYTTDPRPQKALDVSKAFALGCATREELDAARTTAWAAAEAATGAAEWAAAEAAAEAATGAAEWAAAEVAAEAAAEAAAEVATRAAEWTAAWAAAKAEQEKILRHILLHGHNN